MGESSTTLNLAIVGLGKMGVMHAAMASRHSEAKVAALVDRDTALGRHVQSIGVEAPVYSSLKEAAKKENLDAAVISTPSFTHRALADEARQAGLHVMCEKPLAHFLEDAWAMAGAAAENPDWITAVGFMKGHQGLFWDTRRVLREGAIGEIRRFHASVYLSQVFSTMKGWTFTKDRSGGGVLINTGIHLVHLTSLLFGRVNALYCKARPMHSSVEDTLTAIVEMESGVFGTIDMSWSVPGYEVEYTRIVAEGSNGVMELDDFRRRLHLLNDAGEWKKGASVAHQSQFDKAEFTLTPDYCGEGYCNEMADFIEAVKNGRAPRYDFADGLRIQRIVDALYRSSDGAGRVELDPPAGLEQP